MYMACIVKIEIPVGVSFIFTVQSPEIKLLVLLYNEHYYNNFCNYKA